MLKIVMPSGIRHRSQLYCSHPRQNAITEIPICHGSLLFDSGVILAEICSLSQQAAPFHEQTQILLSACMKLRLWLTKYKNIP